MSISKHMPGPWKLSDPRYIRHDDNLELRLDIIAENKHPVVTLVFDRSRSIGEERLTADIGAMLAAPKLLEALEGAEQALSAYQVECGPLMTPGIDAEEVTTAARAAIKKARGE